MTELAEIIPDHDVCPKCQDPVSIALIQPITDLVRAYHGRPFHPLSLECPDAKAIGSRMSIT